MKQIIASIFLFSAIFAAPAQALNPPAGALNRSACVIEHKGQTYGCRSITGNQAGPWWVITKEGPYKTCGTSNNPSDTCQEKDKATHTIEIYKDNGCRAQIHGITVSQMRCD